MAENSKSLVQKSIMRVVSGYKSVTKEKFRAISATIAPMHVRVLRLIDENPNCTSQQIAASMRRDKAQIARLIKKLVSEKLVKVHPCPSDKRRRLLEVTPIGRSSMKELQLVENAAVDQMITGLTKRELDQVLIITHKMGDNLDEE